MIFAQSSLVLDLTTTTTTTNGNENRRATTRKIVSWLESSSERASSCWLPSKLVALWQYEFESESPDGLLALCSCTYCCCLVDVVESRA